MIFLIEFLLFLTLKNVLVTCSKTTKYINSESYLNDKFGNGKTMRAICKINLLEKG